MQDLLNIAAFYTAARLLDSFSAPQLWQAVLVLSPLQLLRRPAALKSALRPARVAAGPVSIWLALQARGSSVVCLLVNTRLPCRLAGRSGPASLAPPSSPWPPPPRRGCSPGMRTTAAALNST